MLLRRLPSPSVARARFLVCAIPEPLRRCSFQAPLVSAIQIRSWFITEEKGKNQCRIPMQRRSEIANINIDSIIGRNGEKIIKIFAQVRKTSSFPGLHNRKSIRLTDTRRTAGNEGKKRSKNNLTQMNMEFLIVHEWWLLWNSLKPQIGSSQARKKRRGNFMAARWWCSKFSNFLIMSTNSLLSFLLFSGPSKWQSIIRLQRSVDFLTATSIVTKRDVPYFAILCSLINLSTGTVTVHQPSLSPLSHALVCRLRAMSYDNALFWL